MLPEGTTDPEYPSSTGVRKDNINLISEWLKNKTVKKTSFVKWLIFHFWLNYKTLLLFTKNVYGQTWDKHVIGVPVSGAYVYAAEAD